MMRMNVAARLDRALKTAGLAISGVSIGDPANKATWKVHPSSLQATAQPTIDSFDPNDPAIIAAEFDAEAARLADDVVLRALARVTWEELQKMQVKAGQTPLDLQGFRDRVKAIVRQILG